VSKTGDELTGAQAGSKRSLNLLKATILRWRYVKLAAFIEEYCGSHLVASLQYKSGTPVQIRKRVIGWHALTDFPVDHETL
jgi:hypothetical protein